MLNTAEMKLLNSDTRQFPMIKAASAALKRCGKCGHRNVNAHTMLNAAVTVYRNNPAFIAHCKSLFPLPCVIGGLLVR